MFETVDDLTTREFLVSIILDPESRVTRVENLSTITVLVPGTSNGKELRASAVYSGKPPTILVERKVRRNRTRSTRIEFRVFAPSIVEVYSRVVTADRKIAHQYFVCVSERDLEEAVAYIALKANAS